jgi:outer membrane protein assembly factor BamB
MFNRLILATAVLLLTAHVYATADWPQFLGPQRNGLYQGAPIVSTFPAAGPRVVWSKKVGQGLSGPVVVGNRVILFHRVGDRELVESLDAATGASHWQYGYPTAYRDDFGFDEGPRAVPVVADGVVYTFGAEGELSAIGLQRGERLWSEHTATQFRVGKGFFGAAGSPLVEGGRVIANIGGEKAGIISFNARKGAVEWTATQDAASYSSPAGATIAGRRYAIFLTRSGLVGLDPATGAVRFQRPWRARANASVNAATPIVVDDMIFISAEYGPGAAVLRLEGSSLTELWSSNDVLSNHYATSVYANGVLYGFHGRQEYGPSLRAVDFRSGQVKWSEEKFGAGTVTLAGDQLLVVRENGELLLAPATPAAFKPTGRAKVLAGTVRAYPALDAGFLYVRNDDTLVCLDLRRDR